MTTRDISAHLREMYAVEVSADLISRVTDGVVEGAGRPYDCSTATSRFTGRYPTAALMRRAASTTSLP